MMPLCTSATRPVRPACGWALTSFGAPWVAQRVWPMPVVDAAAAAASAIAFSRLASLPAFLALASAPPSAAVHQGDPRRVVAAVLQPSQAFDHDVLRLPVLRRIRRCRTWRTELYGSAPSGSGPAAEWWRLRAATIAAMSHRSDRTARSERPAGSARPTSSSTGARGSSLAQRDRESAARRGDHSPAWPGRQPRPPGGRGGLPPAVAPAQPVRRLGRAAAPRAGVVPAPQHPAAHAVRDRRWPARWPSASRPPLACCSRCSPTGPSTPTSRWSPPTASSTRTPSSSGAGLLERKGFPESYDRRALLRFVVDIKSGRDEVEAPTYSHLVYDVVPDEKVVIRRPDIVILEGLNVLQPARVRDDGRAGLTLSDFFDFSVYVDAGRDKIRAWYVERFLRLRETAFRDPESYFRRTPALRRRGRRRGRADLGHDQRPQPGAEHPAHPLPRHPRAPQGPRPLGALRAAAEGLTTGIARRYGHTASRSRTTSASRSATACGLLGGGRLDHHPHQRLGARRAQQHPAGVAERGLLGGDGIGEAVVGRRSAALSTPETLTRTCGQPGDDGGEVAQRATGDDHPLQHVQRGEQAVAGGGVVAHDDVARLLATEVVAARRACPRARSGRRRRSAAPRRRRRPSPARSPRLLMTVATTVSCGEPARRRAAPAPGSP